MTWYFLEMNPLAFLLTQRIQCLLRQTFNSSPLDLPPETLPPLSQAPRLCDTLHTVTFSVNSPPLRTYSKPSF
jgi:hypothetical protein